MVYELNIHLMKNILTVRLIILDVCQTMFTLISLYGFGQYFCSFREKIARQCHVAFTE